MLMLGWVHTCIVITHSLPLVTSQHTNTLLLLTNWILGNLKINFKSEIIYFTVKVFVIGSLEVLFAWQTYRQTDVDRHTYTYTHMENITYSYVGFYLLRGPTYVLWVKVLLVDRDCRHIIRKKKTTKKTKQDIAFIFACVRSNSTHTTHAHTLLSVTDTWRIDQLRRWILCPGCLNEADKNW